jgi:NADPH-dependent 2,4-dienoyl-CoA reductase/sulfur reductase-like enzyme
MKEAVIGGGPAGCAASHALRKRGHEVVLFAVPLPARR